MHRVDLSLRNVAMPDGRVADISIDRGTIAHIGAPLASDETVDCRGLLCLPGAVDMHVHMRGVSQSHKEDWGSGSRSAIAGGVTVVVDQPNTEPPITNAEILGARVLEAQRDSLCHFAINGALMPDADLEGLSAAGAMCFGEAFLAPSTSGNAVEPSFLESALTRINSLGGVATLHAEEVAALPDTNPIEHNLARPAAGEAKVVAWVKRLNRSGCRLHFCHLSTAEAITAASGAGTVEVTPHHLFLSLEQFIECTGWGKVNPPVREEKEVAALWSRWNDIDVIASDHAPHTRQEKGRPFEVAPAGIPGVETMMPLLVARFLSGTISLDSLVNKTSTSPCMILGIQPAGFSTGDRADFALYPRTTTRIDPDMLHSRAGWTPYTGLDATFPHQVIMGGERVYNEGDFFPGHPQWFRGRGFIASEHV